MNRSDIPDLLRVREILATAWTNDWAAITADGSWTIPKDRDACKWCIIGAFAKVSREDLICKLQRDWDLICENRTQTSGIAFIDRVIAELEKTP